MFVGNISVGYQIFYFIFLFINILHVPVLQDIKALFPSDCKPFYAGFGNRDTDEFSYLKVGIPLGKIFIINPKVIITFMTISSSYEISYVLGQLPTFLLR